MSQKANAEMVESNFEKFADKAGWSLEALADHLHDEYGSEDTPEDFTEGMFEDTDETEDTEDTPETPEDTGVSLEDMEHGKKTKLASKGVEMGVLDEYPGNSHEALDNALEGSVSQIVEGSEDTEDTEDTPETSETEGYNVPYENTDSPNDPESYDHPEAIMAFEDIKNHPEYDGSTPVNKLMHYQGKHGVCNVCGVWAAMSGETCNECRKASNGSNGSNDSDKSLMSSLIQNPDNDINTVSQAEDEIAKME